MRFRKSTSGGQGPKIDNADGGPDALEPSQGGSAGPHLTLHASARLVMRAAAAKQRLRGSGGNATELQLPSRANAGEAQAPASSQPAPMLGELRMSRSVCMASSMFSHINSVYIRFPEPWRASYSCSFTVCLGSDAGCGAANDSPFQLQRGMFQCPACILVKPIISLRQMC